MDVEQTMPDGGKCSYNVTRKMASVEILGKWQNKTLKKKTNRRERNKIKKVLNLCNSFIFNTKNKKNSIR